VEIGNSSEDIRVSPALDVPDFCRAVKMSRQAPAAVGRWSQGRPGKPSKMLHARRRPSRSSPAPTVTGTIATKCCNRQNRRFDGPERLSIVAENFDKFADQLGFSSPCGEAKTAAFQGGVEPVAAAAPEVNYRAQRAPAIRPAVRPSGAISGAGETVVAERAAAPKRYNAVSGAGDEVNGVSRISHHDRPD